MSQRDEHNVRGTYIRFFFLCLKVLFRRSARLLSRITANPHTWAEMNAYAGGHIKTCAQNTRTVCLPPTPRNTTYGVANQKRLFRTFPGELLQLRNCQTDKTHTDNGGTNYVYTDELQVRYAETSGWLSGKPIKPTFQIYRRWCNHR